jgi:hypothetical protein
LQLRPTAPLPHDLGAGIGTADLRTPAEDLEFLECENILRTTWTHFAKAGAALARIRDKQLYKNEYTSFEVYCRERWGLGHTQVWRCISAAEVHNNLALVPDLPLPEFEAQVRPLISLTPEDAQEAWLKALSWNRQGYVSPRLVERAVKQLVQASSETGAPKSHAPTQQRYRLRQSIQTGFQELYALLLGNASRDAVIAKAQEIHRLLEPFLNPKKTR